MSLNRNPSSDAQIKKGVLEMCILHMISSNPTYGYVVTKNIRQYFPEVNESTIYAILRRLHDENSADITMNNDSGGPPRKYYLITEPGLELLDNHVASWRRINDALAQMGLQ
jgi:PadR family transcriptional regulator PadR